MLSVIPLNLTVKTKSAKVRMSMKTTLIMRSTEGTTIMTVSSRTSRKLLAQIATVIQITPPGWVSHKIIINPNIWVHLWTAQFWRIITTWILWDLSAPKMFERNQRRKSQMRSRKPIKKLTCPMIKTSNSKSICCPTSIFLTNFLDCSYRTNYKKVRH